MAQQLISSSTITAKDRVHIWHPFTQMQTARSPIPIIKGEGVYIYSEDGRRYLDGIASWWVNLHGHGNPYISDKIQAQARQLEHLIFADFTHRPAVDLAERLLAILPTNLSKVFYSDNGSTAVEVALKIAIQYWHNKGIAKTKVVCLRNSYHGDTFGAMSASGKNAFTTPFMKYLFAVEMIDPPLPGHEEESRLQLQDILEKGDAACFIFEPLVLGTGGMIIYPPSGLDLLMRLCRQHDVLMIADEVMTGFGRTGTLFACDQLHEKPDMICLAKGLTGGFLPMGATVCTQNIFDAFLSDRLDQAFLHGHSYTANPLACASALASLDLLLEESCTAQRNMIANSHEDFCRRWQSHPKLKRCESLGVILALEYRADSSSYFSSMRDRLYHFFLDQGILLRPLGNVLYILPPYCIKAEELVHIYEQIIFTLENF